MYPFGSGTPQGRPPYPPFNPQSVPFGAGSWVQPSPQSPYPGTSPYPPQSSYSHSQSPYPSHMPFPSSSPYPPQGGYPQPSCYPPSQSPYPSHTAASAYPSNTYSTTQQPSYYPPSSTNSPYSQNTGSYPQPQHPTYSSENRYSSTAQCFSEMQSHTPRTFGSGHVQKGTPTVVPAPDFDPVKDAHALRKAMRGFGTDEDALINIICRRTNQQRQEIQRQYKTHFGKDLIEDIKSETSGNFERLLVALLLPIVDFYVKELNDAMAGLGTDEDVLIEVMCTLSNAEIHVIKDTYQRTYGRPLEAELRSETSGNFKRLMVSLCAGGRDESGVTDIVAAQRDARELLNAGELRFGTDESVFNMVLCQRNFEQLKLIFEEYKNITGHSLEKAIKREFSGDVEEGLLAIYQCVTNKAEFFAKRLHKSMAGLGTSDKQLIRLVVTRCEIDMQDIKIAYERLFGKSLRSWIKGDTSGDYKHALYALIGEERSS